MAHGAEAPSRWTCPTCAVPVDSPYCPTCGERRVDARDFTVRRLGYQLFHASTSIDGRLFRSLRRLLTRPGLLTVAYVNGPRKLYLGPFQLFLVANVIFVAAQSVTGMNVFSSTLDSHLHQQDWSSIAQPLVSHRMEAAGTTLEHYAPVFNRSVAFYAKSLIVLMIVPFSAVLPIVFLGRRRPFGVHVVFAAHIYAFLLLLFCITLAIAAVHVMGGGGGLESAGMDNILSTLNFVACATYLYLATGTVYGARGVARVAASLTLTAAVAAIALGYRFGLFLFTLYVT